MLKADWQLITTAMALLLMGAQVFACVLLNMQQVISEPAICAGPNQPEIKGISQWVSRSAWPGYELREAESSAGWWEN